MGKKVFGGMVLITIASTTFSLFRLGEPYPTKKP